ncbi:MAG: hypothetical protein EU547_06285 [Promethearchaeota archaeon]|nr:MAG: hypothetical protein EU547_06285 [Candidatus Lokiarchaeota archaeon]
MEFKDKWYIIIPIICFFGWAFISLLKDKFYIYDATDFDMLYYASKNMFTNPGEVYTNFPSDRYYYAPAFATIFGVIVFLSSFEISIWFLFGALLVIGVLIILEFDKILKLYNIDNIFIRFLFLFVIANGHSIMINFDFMQTKLFVIYFLLLFLRREIQHRKSNKNLAKNNNRFLFWQIMIFVFGIGLVPQYAIFLIIVYFLYNISIREIFIRQQLKKYGLFILVFLIQNFMFIIIFIANPKTISYILEGFIGIGNRYFSTDITINEIVNQSKFLPLDLLSLFIYSISFLIGVPIIDTFFLTIISLIIMFILIIILVLNKRLEIEEKFGYIAFFSLLFNTFYHGRDRVILIPLTALLFIIKVYERDDILKFIKKNMVWLIGLGTLLLINLYPRMFFILRVFTFLEIIPLGILLLAVCLIYIIMGFCILKLRKFDIISTFRKNSIDLNN